MADKIKIVVALLLVAAGVAGFYYFASSPTLLRAASVVAGVVAGAAVAWFSAPGREFVAFARESLVEVQKVVWPTRKESFQTAAAVFAFAVAMAVFLWVVDKGLEYSLYDMSLGWKKS